MKDRIRECVEQLFAESGKNNVMEETKEELILNLFDKFDDLVASGHTEDYAFYKVVSGIGNVDELLYNTKANPAQQEEYVLERERRRRDKLYMLRSIAICMYVLCVVPVILASEFLWGFEVLGLVGMFAMIGGATCLIIYANSGLKNQRHYIPQRQEHQPGAQMPPQPQQFQQADMPYQPIQQQPIENQEYNPDMEAEYMAYNKFRQYKGTFISLIWSVTVILYFVLSFFFISFAYSWIIFIIGALATQAVNVVLYMMEVREHELSGIRIDIHDVYRKIKGFLISATWLITVILYFVLSFAFGFRFTWIIFLVAVAVTQVINLVISMKEANHQQ